MKVKEDTTNVAIHFFPINQFLDFSVSPGLDRVNYGVFVLSLGACGFELRAKLGSFENSSCSCSVVPPLA